MNTKIIFEPMLEKSKPVHVSFHRSEQVLDTNFLSYRRGVDLHCDIISQNCNFIWHKNFNRLSFQFVQKASSLYVKQLYKVSDRQMAFYSFKCF